MDIPQQIGSDVLSQEARHLEADLGHYMAGVLRKKHAAGRSYATLDVDGRVIHVFPDGTTHSADNAQAEPPG